MPSSCILQVMIFALWICVSPRSDQIILHGRAACGVMETVSKLNSRSVLPTSVTRLLVHHVRLYVAVSPGSCPRIRRVYMPDVAP